MHRRRFLAVTAAAPLAWPAGAATPATWSGRAMGAAARVVLHGAEPYQARRVFARIEAVLSRVETHFSLHRNSALTRLNRDGRLAYPAPDVLALFALAARVHRATGGVFDPSIQPLWLATATGGDVEAARRLTGWRHVRFDAEEVALAPGQALTFNGIAQGAAADRVADLLRAEGFRDVLIDMGEVMALGRNDGRGWQAAVAAPDGRELARVALADRALATSSPMGTRIGRNAPHILHPDGRPAIWNTVSVTAPEAATADALSTAFCLMTKAEIARALEHFEDAKIAAIA